jgi:hypothetical protein
VWKPVDGQCVADTESAGDVAFVPAVVLDGWTNVPSVDAVGSYVQTLGWSDMENDVGTWWGKEGGLVEIECAVQASLG